LPFGPRPFGVGPFGAGAFSRWPAFNFVSVAGRPTIRFDVSATRPVLVRQPLAATGITFSVRSVGFTRIMHPWAITNIWFDVWADPWINWTEGPDCGPSVWDPTECNPAQWTMPEPCAVGAWGGLFLPNESPRQ
jgi:hypothetical protein